jgi:hypothetical protein
VLSTPLAPAVLLVDPLALSSEVVHANETATKTTPNANCAPRCIDAVLFMIVLLRRAS